ncbi:MAG TPA: PAS domain S-box protein [Solirubrobacteraceae bacterium]|nr:PAS domain S-box protein [Solirubrobacteraceae bacterium]
MQSPDPTVLLKAEHAVARVLAERPGAPLADTRLLEAIGVALGWDVGATWEVRADDAMACVATWRAPGGFNDATARTRLRRGEGLPGRVWASGRPAHIDDLREDPNFPRAQAARRAGLRCAFAFPVRGTRGVIGAVELFAGSPRRADRALLATMTSVGRQIGLAVERAGAEQALHDSMARKTAMLDAAFDAIITMDADGQVVEVNRATERIFGYRAETMVGRELAELIIPPDLREAHREGLRRYLATGEAAVLDHPVDLTGQRADGSVFPVEIAITRHRVGDGPPLFTGYLRDVTDRRRADAELRELAIEQAALRRVATIVASEGDQDRVFSAVTEEVGRLLGAHSANMVRYEDGPWATVVGGWSAEGTPAVEVGGRVPLDGDTATVRVKRTGRPARVDDYDGLTGELAERLRGLGFRCAVAAPITLAGRLWGAVLVSSVEPDAFPPGAEDRISSFAELTAQALANAEARAQLAASRARIVEAADAERRRLERNLHDGAQQRLVALALAVRLAERKLATDTAAARELLANAGAELEQALAELRELARGLHPAVLTERGLAPALGALADRAPVPVEVAAAVEGRLPAPVEAAAYYVVSEALTNVAKYAGACRVRVDVSRCDGQLEVTVADNGVGGADGSRGSGLRGLADRVEALGGRLEVSSPVGAGTTLRARLPCVTR